MEKQEKFNTREKRIATLKKKGNIITFKDRFFWKGESFSQILILDFETDKKSGAVKLVGFSRDTKWFNSVDDLLKAIDWEWMENNIMD